MHRFFQKHWNLITLSLQDFEHQCEASTIVLSGKRGPRVLEYDNYIYKIFAPRKRFSSDRIWPYAVRFYRNAQRLRALGVGAPHADQLAFCPENRCYWVRYYKVHGLDCRAYAGQSVEILDALARFMAELHDKGIFFRGIHLGNVLYEEASQQLCLLDIASCYFSRGPLSLSKRLRNLKHLLHYPDDQAHFMAFGRLRFLQTYCAHAPQAYAKKVLSLS